MSSRDVHLFVLFFSPFLNWDIVAGFKIKNKDPSSFFVYGESIPKNAVRWIRFPDVVFK